MKVTGGLDDKTVNQMVKPRCGVANIVNGEYRNKSIHNVGHFKLFRGNPKWLATQNHLRYRFLNGVINKVPGTEYIMFSVARAFNRWAKVLRFSSEEVPENSTMAEIDSGFHGKVGLGWNDGGFDGRLVWGFWLLPLPQLEENYTLMWMRIGVLTIFQGLRIRWSWNRLLCMKLGTF
ncbi:Peptidoglycan binding-like protein [Corchorus olitorius]|uniref:Peptidoglycan binding-like protein n=1 Tax=Corchorus olitorius TaxID=93759 RepID=A0A1R3G8S1_9ROSI|nr:Peptidoglycan binding-like protein [Corchorus olitorius]